MPIYKVKPEKNPGPAETTAAPGKKRYPTVYMPVSKEIVDSLELDAPVTVTLKGTVCGLNSSQDEYNKDGRSELRIELRQVEAYPDKEPPADDDEEPEEDMQGAISKGLGYGKGDE